MTRQNIKTTCPMLLLVLFILISPFQVTAQNRQGILWVDWSPDGSKIATAGTDGKVRLWSLSGQLLTTFNAHQGRAYVVEWNPVNNNEIATAGEDHTIKVWDLTIGQSTRNELAPIQWRKSQETGTFQVH
jgi:WD40 repeat protein